MPHTAALAGVLLLAAAATFVAAQAPVRRTVPLAGQVVDISGTPVGGATVRARANGSIVAASRTSADGRFLLDVPPGLLEVVAAANDLATASVAVTVPSSGRLDEVRLVLGAGLFSESVTVSANVPESASVPASSSVLTSEVLNIVPGRALDDALASTPGFGLFRRSSSRVANPTTQGVSLRGLAASGASRALVLEDGVPANDPFGGWVYWNRVPRAAIERAEVARGGFSDRYGADAVGGVVQVLTAPAGASPDVRALVEAGSRGTGRASGFAGLARTGWNAVGAVEGGRSGRAPVVASAFRGPVDTAAGSNYVSGLGAVTWTAGPSFSGRLRINPFREDRANGTAAQRNDTRSVQLSASASGAWGFNGWEVRAWGQRTRFGQTFSAVSRDRSFETPTTTQRVEADAFGVRGQWFRTIGSAVLFAGGEARQVQADNLERPTLGGAPPRTAGGRQRGPAIFARLAAPLGSRVSVEGGGRWESWMNVPSGGGGAHRRASSFSPRLSLAWRPVAGAVAHAAAYRAFRAPTLNELYRGFRVGAIVTLPNAGLAPEHLTGVEAGVSVTRRRVSLRTTGWWSRLDEPVVNVTTAPQERQRQNIGQVRGRGVEAEVVFRPFPALEWTSAVALTRSTFRDPMRPDLDGRRVPQVPGTQISSRLRLTVSRFSASVEVRRVGLQYEDDRNELVLSPGSLADLAVAWAVSRRLDVVVGVENVADREVVVGRTPIPTVGLPRSAYVSVRVRTALGGRRRDGRSTGLQPRVGRQWQATRAGGPPSYP